MSILNYSVQNTDDDGSWHGGYLDNTYPLVGTFNGNYFDTWFRWRNVTIPAGAIITAAYISVYYSDSAGYPSGILYFNDAANPAIPVSVGDLNNRVKTTNHIVFNPPISGYWSSSSSIVAIIQELVDSYDFSGGAAMMALWMASGPLNNYWATVADYGYYPAYGAKLHIEYDIASGKKARGQWFGVGGW